MGVGEMQVSWWWTVYKALSKQNKKTVYKPCFNLGNF